MRFSILIPVYNGASFLNRAVESVLAQDWTDWEMWIVDDASTDETWSLACSWAARDPRIRIHQHPKNLGQGGNLEFCLRLAQGDWIGILPADDAYRPGLFERLNQTAQAHPHMVMWIHRHACFHTGSAPQPVSVDFPQGLHRLGELARCLWLRGNVFGELSSFLVRLEAVQNSGARFGKTRLSVDARFWMDLAVALDPPGARSKTTPPQFYFSQEVFADVLLHPASGSAQFQNNGENWRDFFDFITTYQQLCWHWWERLWQRLRLCSVALKRRSWRTP